MWTDIERSIAAVVGAAFRIEQRIAVRGGCINAAWTVSGAGQRYFVKVNDAPGAAMFEAEVVGLHELASANAVRVPRPICAGANESAAWLVLEFVALTPRDGASDETLGRQLAELHRQKQDVFGWQRDNTIGSTPQRNAQSRDWPAFWRDRRLSPQLDFARRNGHTGKLQTQGEKLLARVDDFFASYRPQPSLLHGDLWSGNAARDESGAPVLFDPAVYYGDREADVAMTELFGGFSPRFHSAYREAWPLDAGYETRRDLYNLYHVLNHLNLFGGGYLAQAERVIEKLLNETL